MTQPTHELALRGCAPAPLAHYLKALGILRLVAEQADPQAQGWWQNDTFRLRSRLDREALIAFFLEAYRPSPIVGPWGARSGFFSTGESNDSEGAARTALDRICESEDSRLSILRTAIENVHQLLERHEIHTKPEKGDENFRLMMTCRNELPDEVLAWLDSALVLLVVEAKCPPLLGTGGNEGSGSYMSGFAQTVVSLIIDCDRVHSLEMALFDKLFDQGGTKQTPGHFLPFATGGPNAGNGFDSQTSLNQWDYILCIEGTLVFSGSIARKLDAKSPGVPAYPFCVEASGVGYASSSLEDESSRRPEIWLPFWERPTRIAEVRQLFAEGRANIGRRRACTSTDFARAVATLGTDHGIDAFERVGFQLRNGDRANFSLSLGRVSSKTHLGAELLDDLDEYRWLNNFRVAASDDKAPRIMRIAIEVLETAIFNGCRSWRDTDVQFVLSALGEAEAVIAGSAKRRETLRPVPLLSPQWLSAANDESTEFRLAAALASVWHSQVGPFRRHLEPIDMDKFPTRTKKGFVAWAEDDGDPAVVWGGGSLVRNLNAVLSRRLIDVLRLGKAQGENDLFAPLGGQCWAALEDVQAFIRGEVDVRRIEALLKGLMLLDWRKVTQEHRPKLPRNGDSQPDAAYALLKLCHLAGPLKDTATQQSTTIKLSSQITRLALNGDLFGATKLAAHQLRVSGIPPAVDGVHGSRDRALRTAAALLFPISALATLTLRRTVECRHLREDPDQQTQAPDAEPVSV
jgi:CRISPR-associated protein Csx17